MRTSAQGRLSRRIRWGRGKRVASPRGQNQKGSQMHEKTNFDDVVGDGGGSELEYLKISLCGHSRGASKDLFHKGRWEVCGSHKDSRRPRGVAEGTQGRACQSHAQHPASQTCFFRARSVLQLWRLWNQEATKAKTLPVLSVSPLGIVEAVHNGGVRLCRTVRIGFIHSSVWPPPPPPPPLQQPLGQQEAAAQCSPDLVVG